MLNHSGYLTDSCVGIYSITVGPPAKLLPNEKYIHLIQNITSNPHTYHSAKFRKLLKARWWKKKVASIYSLEIPAPTL